MIWLLEVTRLRLLSCLSMVIVFSKNFSVMCITLLHLQVYSVKATSSLCSLLLEQVRQHPQNIYALITSTYLARQHQLRRSLRTSDIVLQSAARCQVVGQAIILFIRLDRFPKEAGYLVRSLLAMADS